MTNAQHHVAKQTAEDKGASPRRVRTSSEVLFFEALQISIRRKRLNFAKELILHRARQHKEAILDLQRSEQRLSDTEDDLRQLEGAQVVANDLTNKAGLSLSGAPTPELLLDAADKLLPLFAQAVSRLKPTIQQSIDRFLEARLREFVVQHSATVKDGATKVFKLEPDARIGLALSGGGIRSASFSLGSIEALSKAELLTSIDVVSSVSGGGYAASWLAAWSYRHGRGIEGVQEEFLHSHEAKIGPLRWVRRHCVYLAPRSASAASSDVWHLLIAWASNWWPVVWMLLAALFILFSLPQAILTTGEWLYSNAGDDAKSFLLFATLAATVSFASILRRITIYYRIPTRGGRYPAGRPALLFYGCLAVTILLSLCVSWSTGFTLRDWPSRFSAMLFAVACIFALSSVGARLLATRLGQRTIDWLRTTFLSSGSQFAGALRLREMPLRTRTISALVNIIVGAAVLTGLLSLWHEHSNSVRVVIALGPLALVGTFGMAELSALAVIHRHQEDRDRAGAWRVGAWLLYGAIAWTALCAVAIGLEPARAAIKDVHVAVALVAVSIAAVLFWRRRPRRVDFSFAAVMLVVLSMQYLVVRTVAPEYPRVATIQSADVVAAWSWFFSAIVVMLLASAIANANRFSLHAIYKEGLVRTFLGASRLGELNLGVSRKRAVSKEEETQFQSRKPDPFTDIDDADDPQLEWLGSGKNTDIPVFVLNATLNGRSAADVEGRVPRQWSFTFSPDFCGSSAAGVGFVETCSFQAAGSADGVSLGTAMAVSGAAMSPTAGKSTRRMRALVLGILNARLGLWVVNPSNTRRVGPYGPATRGWTVLREALGVRTRFGKWIHLSDGGHFENLGIYELLRKRLGEPP